MGLKQSREMSVKSHALIHFLAVIGHALDSGSQLEDDYQAIDDGRNAFHHRLHATLFHDRILLTL